MNGATLNPKPETLNPKPAVQLLSFRDLLMTPVLAALRRVAIN